MFSFFFLCISISGIPICDCISIMTKAKCKVWSLEFSESVDRRSIHQLAATCKTNKKTTVVFRRPFDGKVSFFLEDLEFGTTVISIRNILPHLM